MQRQLPQSQTVQKTVDVPFVRFIDRVVDVPVTVQRQVPIVQMFPTTVVVPQNQRIGKVIDVSAVMQRQVPIIQKVQKAVEVPHFQRIGKVVDVHALLQRQVPFVQNARKIVVVLQVQYIGKVVDVPVVLRRQVPVLENVQIAVVVPQVQCSDKILEVPGVRQRLVPTMQTSEAAHVLSCETIISLHRLARQISSAQCFKGPGLDGITNDMLKGSPQQAARHLYPLLCKMSLGCKEPLMLKGSLATDLYKGRVCKLDMTSYKSIVCRSVLSKHHHKFLRSRLLTVVAHSFFDTQCGGIPDKGVDMASLLLRSFLARVSALKRTALVIFSDVNTAFCAVIRQNALPGSTVQGRIL